MIRTIDCKIKKTVKHLLMMVFCLSMTINSSFLFVNAQSTNHNHQTFTGGRLEYEINTYDAIQDVTVDGTTFRATGIIILNYYLTNTSTGTLRFYFTGFNSNVYQTMNIYTYGATISNVVYSGAGPGITFKINNPVDRVTVVITFTSTDMNSTLQNLTPSTGASLTTASSNDTTVQDIDIKLSGISSTLQQILTILGSGNTSITDYLDDISAYSSYLDDIQLSLSDIDNQIDIISWNDIPVSYAGFTSDLSSYDPSTGYHGIGYYVYNNFVSYSATTGIIKLIIPIGDADIKYTDIKIGTLYTDHVTYWDISDYIYFQNRMNITIYLYVNDKFTSAPNGEYPFVVYVNKWVYLYSTTNQKAQYILQDDIEYWTILQAIQNKKLLDSISQLVVAQDSSSVVDPINDKIDELNDITQQTQTIENQQIDNLESFNQSIDLNDYDFDFTNRNGIEYFKLKLTNIYDIEEFKPFYLIPIMLFILGVILRG